MTSQSATTKTLSHLIDAADALLPGLTPDEAWLKSVDLVGQLGGNALNVVEIDRTTRNPLWFRSSMHADWLNDYFAQDFISVDPLILLACDGQPLTRMTDGKVKGINLQGPQPDALRDQVVQWGYHSLDYHVFAPASQDSLKALTYSHDERRPLPGKTEKLVCALIATVVTPPDSNDWPTAARWMAALLSTREKDVLRYLAAGLRNDAIASKLGIAEITVRIHITSARRKLGAATREQAIALAIRSGQLAL